MISVCQSEKINRNFIKKSLRKYQYNKRKEESECPLAQEEG